jgi:hypothetical protein
MTALIARAAWLLRDPASLVDELDDPERFAVEAPRLLGLLALGGLTFGAVVGGYRGGLQVPFAALKLPLLFLVPMVLVLPALRGLWALCEVDVSYRRLVAAGLVGGARTALLAAAAGPVLWLWYGVVDYHVAVMSFVAVLAACGLPGLLVVARAVPSGGRSRWMALAGSLALLAVGSMQTGWLLRPFLVRPQSDDIVLFRAVEDDVFHGLGLTALSSLHIYREPRPTVEPYERRTR